MEVISQIRQMARRLAFGDPYNPLLCNLSLPEPQTWIQVFLTDGGTEQDVTYTHAIASTRPLTIVIADPGKSDERGADNSSQMTLKFKERNGHRLLGEIGLEFCEGIRVGDTKLLMFQTKQATNYCYSSTAEVQRRLQMLYQAMKDARNGSRNGDKPSRGEIWALFVYYICPRPIFLISVATSSGANTLVPMDLVGTPVNNLLSLALHATSSALPLIESSRQLAVSSVPSHQISLAYQMGSNHHNDRLDWNALPFPSFKSETFGLPVPDFALRVREVKVEWSRPMGSHTFIVAKVISDRSRKQGDQFFQAHSSYGPWRDRALAS